jgi:hypothetical protein
VNLLRCTTAAWVLLRTEKKILPLITIQTPDPKLAYQITKMSKTKKFGKLLYMDLKDK